MKKRKKEKLKNYDTAEVVGRELQSPYRAPSIPAPPPRPKKHYFGHNNLDIYQKIGQFKTM